MSWFPFFFFRFYILKVVTHLRDAPCCWEMLPSAGCTLLPQSHAYPLWGRDPSEQLQTPSDIVHHLLLAHDGQNGVGAGLHLPETGGVGLVPQSCSHKAAENIPRISSHINSWTTNHNGAHKNSTETLRMACFPHLGEPRVLDQVSGQAEAHGQSLQLQQMSHIGALDNHLLGSVVTPYTD